MSAISNKDFWNQSLPAGVLFRQEPEEDDDTDSDEKEDDDQNDDEEGEDGYSE
jgi:hypothetical protein